MAKLLSKSTPYFIGIAIAKSLSALNENKVQTAPPTPKVGINIIKDVIFAVINFVPKIKNLKKKIICPL